MTDDLLVRIEYLHNDGHVATIEVPRGELLGGGDLIVRGIERYGARVIEPLS